MREMKDSGIDYIGQIPFNWKECRLKFLCLITTGNEDTQNSDPDGEFPFYVRSPIIEKSKKYTFDGEGILVAGDGAGAGRIFHHAYGKYAVHQRVYRLYNFGFNSNFICYYLSNLFPFEMDKGSAQSTVPSMRLPMLCNFTLFLPELTIASKIADFLDQKCSEIDALTTDIQTQIETLKEYKKSVITEAVTKGLDPNVEMKDSGVEWIGKISKTFKVSRIKFCYKVILGKMVNSTRYPEESMSNYLCAANIKWNGVDTSIHKKMYISKKEKLNILLDKGDILIMEGGNAGTACIYNNEFYPCYIQNSVHR